MTDKQILEKAIQKAIDSGWRNPWMGKLVGIESDVITGEIYVIFQYRDLPIFKWSLFGLIYSSDFAKALWGEGLNEPEDNGYRMQNKSFIPLRIWQWHLTQMVISDDPIKYLGENL